MIRDSLPKQLKNRGYFSFFSHFGQIEGTKFTLRTKHAYMDLQS